MKRLAAAVMLVLVGPVPGGESGESTHVPPEPPQSHVHPMPYREMAEMMGMDDRKRFGKVMIDRLEWRDAASDSNEWDTSAWYGGDFNKLWFETEGDRIAGNTTHARIEVLWDRILTAWWSTRLGLRQDFGEGPTRSWVAFGVAGLAPGFIDVEAMAYAGGGDRLAMRLAANHDLLITQRLVLQPEAELNVYSSDDPERLIGTGLSDLELGLRLRYEIRREVAPYLGVSWSRRFGDSADLARAAGDDPDDISWVAGIRLWF
jgi:copper resistance protein B